MNFAKTFPSGYISGQKYADGQTGTDNTPFALQSFKDAELLKQYKKPVDKVSFLHLSTCQ